MRWFVIARDGKKYGPADLATLQQWVQEKRVDRDMMLEEELTGRRLRADTLAGLVFPGSPGSPSAANAAFGSGHAATSTPSGGSFGAAPRQYWVIGPDGKRYGPADSAKLQQWAAEGRINHETMLEDTVSGEFIRATAFPGLVLNTPQQANPWSQAPGSPYPRQGSGYYAPSPSGANDLTWAWVLSVLGFLCCVPLCFVGWYYADRAKKAGVPGADAAYIVSAILCVIGIVVWVVNIIFVVSVPNALDNL